MLRDLLIELCKDLSIDIPKVNEQKIYPFILTEDAHIDLKDLEPGISMQAKICPCPTERKEDLFIYLMRANLLGQGTGGCRIGMDGDEKFLTLSLGLPYELNYKTFKESLEDFVNYLFHWRECVTKFEREENLF